MKPARKSNREVDMESPAPTVDQEQTRARAIRWLQ